MTTHSGGGDSGSTKRALPDEYARERIRSALDETLVVEAAAGTGKTTALVGRIIEIIRTGRGEVGDIVAVTFTEKAAGELKLRLRSALEDARSNAREAGDAASTKRLERGIAQLEEAHIGTIHGFCADILRGYPLQAGIDPRFEVATDEQSERMYARVFDRWLEEKIADPPPGVRRLLRRPLAWDRGPVDALFDSGWKLIDVRDFPARWKTRAFDRENELDDLVERLYRVTEMAETSPDKNDNLYRDLDNVVTFVRELRSAEEISGKRDYDFLEAKIPTIQIKKRKGRGAYSTTVKREDLLAEREALTDAIQDFKKRAGADLASHLHQELQELVTRYQALKEKRGMVDFLDLLTTTRDLLKTNETLRADLQKEFTHLFVDEFQDTDPIQAEILLLLCADDPRESDWRRIQPTPGKLFIVADPKQSIYRFRRADIALYQSVKRQLVAAGAKAEYLTTSFRSVPEIQELVNAAMSKAMKQTDKNHQADYVALSPHRDAVPERPSLVALPVPRPYSWGQVRQWAVAESEPQAVAAWVQWLIEESGWEVTSRGSKEPRPIRASDICLLFRRFRSGRNSVTQPYVDAFSARDIPHVLMGGRGFYQREEIEAMRVALTAIERPDDELSVFATLRGPLFSISDEDLFLFRSRHHALHPFREPKAGLEDGDDQVLAAMGILAKLHRNRNHRPIALTIRELLDATRAQAGFALWQSGDQVLANVLRLMQLARSFEESGGLSFRGFVDRLDALSEDKDQQTQPLIEDGVDGVRLMTVHRAKGLEFPVVILCDITCSLFWRASRHVDADRKLFAVPLAGASPWELLEHEEVEIQRDEAEGLRLLYVAATRARDILAVPVVADQKQEKSWVAPLWPALYPNEKNWKLPVVPPSCPRFGFDECVVVRPDRAPIPPGFGIRPGQHRPEIGEHDVVWWDPHLFEGQTPTKPGLRRHWILQAEPSGGAGEGAAAHAEWRTRVDALVASGSAPSLSATTVTKLSEDEVEDPEAAATARSVVVEEVSGRDLQRPSGKRFGALVHEMLARVSLESDAPFSSSAIESLAEATGRVLDATTEEMEAAVECVRNALAHPLLTEAREAEESFRETPIVFRDANGRLIEGVPDLVYRCSTTGTQESKWTVLDFKTDLRLDIGEDVYRRQVALYVRAIARTRAGPETVRGVLLYV